MLLLLLQSFSHPLWMAEFFTGVYKKWTREEKGPIIGQAK